MPTTSPAAPRSAADRSPPISRRAVLVGGLALGLGACAGTNRSTSRLDEGARAPSGPRPGGTLRVGIVGDTNDIVDGQYIRTKTDIARLVTGWESLATYDGDFDVSFERGLAESVEWTSPDSYVIRVRDGIEFHDGRPLGAADVAYSFRRAIDPTLGVQPALAALLDPGGIVVRDRRTVEVRLNQPSVTFLDLLASYYLGVVPEGYSRDDPVQIGTGPFRLERFTPGSESIHVRHPGYWQEGGPHLDEVHIIDFADSAALLNALLAEQVDCAVDIPFAEARLVEATDGVELLESVGGTWLPITMAIDQPPFDDVRVRQAFRLIVDRHQVVERVFSGHGRIANDMYAPLDPCYPTDIPQRVQDLDAARALLAEAGQQDLEVDLHAPTDIAGLVDMAKVFADHAAQAGVKVNVRVLPAAEYWGPEYTRRTFATGFWGTRAYLPQVPLSSLHDAVHPETHWPPEGSDFADRYRRAIATTDEAERCRIVHQMQEEEHQQGGNIIAAFSSLLDAHASRVKGFVARPNVLNMDHYGRGFKDIWLDG